MQQHADSAARPTGRGSVKGLSWHHAGLVVANLDEALTFYQEILGYQVEFLVRNMAEQFQRTVGVDGVVCDLAQLVAPFAPTRLELIEVRNVPSGLSPALPVHVGVGHGAYQVADLNESIDGLLAAGGSLIGEVVEFAEGPAVYCWSPAGTVVELEQIDPGDLPTAAAYPQIVPGADPARDRKSDD